MPLCASESLRLSMIRNDTYTYDAYECSTIPHIVHALAKNSISMIVALSIKNMVCARCIRAVDRIVRQVGLDPVDIRLGEVLVETGHSHESANEVHAGIDSNVLEQLRAQLEREGFELLDDKRQQLIENIKSAVINLVHHGDEETLARVRISDYLREKLHTEYAMMSSLFSQLEGITLEKYVIHQKIERVKELMMYDEQSLSEIAHRMGYSSVHHLSNQFKRVTGMTPTEFKKSYRTRVPLDRVGLQK